MQCIPTDIKWMAQEKPKIAAFQIKFHPHSIVGSNVTHFSAYLPVNVNGIPNRRSHFNRTNYNSRGKKLCLNLISLIENPCVHRRKISATYYAHFVAKLTLSRA